MSNVKKLMMSAAGGGGDWFTNVWQSDPRVDGVGSLTTGETLSFGVNEVAGEEKNDAYLTTSGETIQVIRCIGSGTTGITGALIVKYDTDGTVLASKALNTISTSGVNGSHPRLYPYGSTYDYNNDILYVVGYASYVSVTGYGSQWGGVAKIDATNMSLDEFYVYPTNFQSVSNRGWFEDACINKNNGNLMCVGVYDISGTGYRGAIWEINPSTMAQVGAALFGSGGAYFNCVDTDSSGNIYVGGYDAYAKSSLIKMNSSYQNQWNYNIDDNGQLTFGLKVKGSYVYVLREDSNILTNYSNIPVAINKFDLNGTNQWTSSATTSGAHADPQYNGYAVRGFDFDSSGDIIIAHNIPGNYRSLPGGTNNFGVGFTKLNDSDGDYNWTVTVLPYTANSNCSVRYNPGGITIKDGRIACAGKFFNYNYESSSSFVNSKAMFALNLPEDPTSISFANNNLFAPSDVPQLSTTISGGPAYEVGIRIDDVSTYWTMHGIVDTGGSSVSSSLTTLSSSNTAPTDFLSSCRYHSFTPYSETNISLA